MKPCPTIAVVGASARATAFSLLRAGCRVVTADLFADADLARACSATKVTEYPEGLADWLAKIECDGWLYTGALENHPELIDRMASISPLLGNGGDALRRVRNLLGFQQILTEADLNFPITKVCDGSPPGDGDWLHKTGQGGNGSGVQRWHSLRAGGFIPPVVGYWQRIIEGIPGSAQYLANDGSDCTLVGITRQLVGEPWLGASDFQYCGTLAPWDLPTSAVDDLKQAGRVLTDRTGLRGLFGVDFIFDGERVWVLEANPRVTAAIEVVERVTGRNLLAEYINDFGIGVERSEKPRFPCAGKVVLYAKYPFVVSPQLSEQLIIIGGSINLPLFADIPGSDTQISQGAPILTILAIGNDLAAVESELRDWVVILEGYFYRDSGVGPS